MKKSKMIVPALVLGVATIVGVSSFSSVSANEGEQYPPIVQKIAEKFNLNQDEVNQVFEENRKEKREEMRSKKEEHLNKLVNEGKLTEDQKNALITKMDEMHEKKESRREELKNLSQEERKEKMKEYHKADREEMKQFFEEQGIDPKEIFPKRGNGMKQGGKPGFGQGNSQGHMGQER